MADIFAPAFNRSNNFGEVQWNGAGLTPDSVNQLQEDYWLGPLRHGLQSAGMGTSVRNPWASYVEDRIGKALPGIYQIMTGATDMSGLNDFAARTFREAGSTVNQAGGWIGSQEELRSFVQQLLNGGGVAGNRLDPASYGDTRDGVGAYAAAVGDLLTGAASMAYNPSLAAAFQSQLNNKFKDFQAMIGQVGSQGLSFLDYLRGSGFLEQWGLA